jgi:hypothetical protein
VPDRGHSAKKRNKPPRRTFLLPSLISLSLTAPRHPRAAVDSPPRQPLAAPSGRPSPRPRLATAVPAAHRAVLVVLAVTTAVLAVPAPAALAVLAVPAAAPAVPLTRARRARRARARAAVPLVMPLATAARPRVPSSPPREVYTFYASIHHVVVDLPSYSHLHHEAL